MTIAKLSIETIAVTALIMCSSLLLAGCTNFKIANGRVTDTFGMPLDNVIVTLEHSRGLNQATTTNNLGEFYLDVIEPCLLFCVGDNPILSFTQQDYETVETILEQFGNVCVNAWMRVVGDRTRESRIEFC
jgi:hypothetical protein